MKIGKPKSGIRWHPSYDADHVRSLVAAKVYNTLGKAAVDWIEVVHTARTTGSRMDTKNL
jgi:hypothetical protein